MKVVDKQAVTVVRKLWNAVADNSRIPKFIKSVSQQLPKRSSNNFNIPLFDVRNPKWTHVQTRKQPMLKPFRLFLLRCTCSFGILITVGIVDWKVSSDLQFHTSQAQTKRSKQFECWANTTNNWDHFISWGHFWALLLCLFETIYGLQHHAVVSFVMEIARYTWNMKERSNESMRESLKEKEKRELRYVLHPLSSQQFATSKIIKAL